MPPTRMALAAKGSTPEVPSNSSGGEATADQKAAALHPEGLQQPQTLTDPDPDVGTGSGKAQCPLEALTLAGSSQGDEQHAEAHSSGSADESHSPKPLDHSRLASHASHRERNVDKTESQHQHGTLFDAQHGGVQNSAAGQQIESRFVHGVYDIIAGHFSATRFAIWPKVSCRPCRLECMLAWRGTCLPLHAC